MPEPITPENRAAFIAFVEQALDAEGTEIAFSQSRPAVPHPETGQPMPGLETVTVLSMRFVKKHNTLTESK